MKLREVQEAMSRCLIERDDDFAAIMTGAVARENVFLAGDPGTGKSVSAETFTASFHDAKCFKLLLTKHTDPDEVFGAVNVPLMVKESIVARKLDNFAADADVVFLDEVWKSSSALLNNLLLLLNERQIDNGGVRVNARMKLCVAASNEWPLGEDQQELAAIFDRFLIRKTVRRVSRANRRHLLYDNLPTMSAMWALADLEDAQRAAVAMPVADSTMDAYDEILDELESKGILCGDRRLRLSVKVAKARAVIEGDSECLPKHLEFLHHTLWRTPDQFQTVSDVIMKIVNPIGAKINSILAEVEEAISVRDGEDSVKRLETMQKLDECSKELDALVSVGNGRAKAAKEYVQKQIAVKMAKSFQMSDKSIAALFGNK